MGLENDKKGFHYGWVIVLAGFLSLFACLGLARFAFGMLLPSMRAGLELAYDQAGFISTGNFCGYLVSVALAPMAIRRFRPRLTISAGLLLIAGCMFGISQASGFWAVLLLYTVIGMGSGFANIPAMVLVAHWFRRQRRGRAAGTMIMGNGSAIVLAGLCIPLLNAALGGDGWRTSWLLIGFLVLSIAVAAGLLIRNDPADMGLQPVGEPEPAHPDHQQRDDAPNSARVLMLLGVLYLVFGATYVIYGTFIVTTMVEEYAFSEARAGLFWSWVGIFSVFSGVGFGTLSDRIGRKKGLMVVFAIQTVAYLLAGSNPGDWALLLSVVLYGISAFAIPTIMAAAVGDYLGVAHAAAAFSLITFFFAIGQTIGPATAGMVAKASGTFTHSYLASAALTGLAILLATALPKPGGER